MDAVTIRDWGMFNDSDPDGRLIPHPTVVILDKTGVVRYVFIETNYRLRPASSELVDELRSIVE